MRAIWKRAIFFGLVNIPIALFPATRTEDLKFHLLRASDLSPVNYADFEGTIPQVEYGGDPLASRGESKLRQPVFLGIPADKAPAEVTREIP